MIVSHFYKTIEDNYGTILAIFTIFIMLYKIIKSLRKFIFRFLILSSLYAVNFKSIEHIVFA